MKSNILIFCPDIDGHRQNYIYVLSDWFISQGRNVLIAAGRTIDGFPPQETPLLKVLASRDGATNIDLGDTTGSHLLKGHWLQALTDLERRYRPEWTIFPTGDEIRVSLAGLGTFGRLSQTRRAAFFIRVNHYYWPDFTGLSPVARARGIWHWLRHRRKQILYFKETVWHDLGLDIILTTNPDFLARISDKRFCYLPEIYRAWGAKMNFDGTMISGLCKDYEEFIRAHQSHEVILYYGGWYARRGYDSLLRLACENKDTVFVSYGRTSPDEAFEYDVSGLRNELKLQDRIFEVELPFLPENELVDKLFASSNFMMLPYHAFYGMSGSLIQSVAYGKPVVVPNIGYMGTRAKRDGIGLTFRHQNMEDLRSKFRQIRGEYRRFIPAVQSFAAQFDVERLDLSLKRAFSSQCSGNPCV